MGVAIASIRCSGPSRHDAGQRARCGRGYVAVSTLSASAVLALATVCQPPNAVHVAPEMLLAIARHESALDPSVIHINTNGTRDYGLMQISERNFAWLGLTPQTALDPCASIRAGAAVLTALSVYNTGSPTRGIANGYAIRVMDTLDATRIEHAPDAATGRTDQQQQPQPACDRTADAWANDPCKPPDQDFVHHYGDTPQ
jgi:type IV secretion system protein VirB1